MLRKAIFCLAIVGLSAVDGKTVLKKRFGANVFGGLSSAINDGYGAPAYEQPSAPADGYGVPVAAPIGEQSPSYDEPAASYGEPAPSYGEPDPSYGEPVPTYGAEEVGFPDLMPIIVAILALIGLSLMFPTNVKVDASGRRKRDAEETNPMTDVVERINDIYNSVITSEHCMERIACELGGLASHVGLKESPMSMMAELFVTAKYKPYYKEFKSGQNCEKIKCGSLPF